MQVRLKLFPNHNIERGKVNKGMVLTEREKVTPKCRGGGYNVKRSPGGVQGLEAPGKGDGG